MQCLEQPALTPCLDKAMRSSETELLCKGQACAPSLLAPMLRPKGQSYLGCLTHNVIVHSLQRRGDKRLPRLSTSKTLSRPPLYHMPKVLAHSMSLKSIPIFLRHLLSNPFTEVILSLYLRSHLYFPFLLREMTLVSTRPFRGNNTGRPTQ